MPVEDLGLRSKRQTHVWDVQPRDQAAHARAVVQPEITPRPKAKTRRKTKAKMESMPGQRSLSYRRAGGRCEARCDPGCRGRPSQLHHRRMRSQGGDNRSVNLLAVCDICHGTIHANPALSYERGLLVHSWDDPAAVDVVPGQLVE